MGDVDWEAAYRAVEELARWVHLKQMKIPMGPAVVTCAEALGVHIGCEHEETA
jgi:hypothetical protein